jgi:lipopolysaccharide transport system permease protein
MLIFTFVFEYIAKLPSESEVPYPLLIFSGLLPWTFFSNALLESSNSLISNTNLISKVYFPRLIIPASSIITSFIDFLISFLIFVFLIIYYKYTLNWHIIFLPIYIIFTFFFILGLGIFLSAINVKYRDFRYIVPFIIQLGLYISPIGYSSKIIPEKWLWLYSLNPMVLIIDGFRWCFFGTESNLNLFQITFSLLFILFLLWLGLYEFRKMEKRFADFI